MVISCYGVVESDGEFGAKLGQGFDENVGNNLKKFLETTPKNVCVPTAHHAYWNDILFLIFVVITLCVLCGISKCLIRRGKERNWLF